MSEATEQPQTPEPVVVNEADNEVVIYDVNMEEKKNENKEEEQPDLDPQGAKFQREQYLTEMKNFWEQYLKEVNGITLFSSFSSLSLCVCVCVFVSFFF